MFLILAKIGANDRKASSYVLNNVEDEYVSDNSAHASSYKDLLTPVYS